jgi:polyhydroxyalkanoate synthesis regulator phasin
MSPDDKRKRYQNAGADLIEQARQRAEAFLRDIASVGETTQHEAGSRIDELFAAGKFGADQLVEGIRREIASQLSSIGVATKKDLADLERRVTSAGPAKRSAPAAKKTATKKAAPAAKKSAPVKATATKKATAVKKAPAKKAAGARKAASR